MNSINHLCQHCSESNGNTDQAANYTMHVGGHVWELQTLKGMLFFNSKKIIYTRIYIICAASLLKKRYFYKYIVELY